MVEPTLVAHPADARADLPIDLALQGGGAHGAFTWGVVERLFEEPRLRIESITGASAGSMNAVVIAHGYALGGTAGVKAALERFWGDVSDAASFSPVQRTPFDRATGNWSLDSSPGYWFFDLFSRMFSPYEFNPLNLNPLRDALEVSVDFEALRRGACPIKLFLSATNVRTGKVKVFERHEIEAKHVLASGCLPFMFQAVEIEGEDYWDGGYMGNPAIFPLIHGCESKDIVVVHINPLERDKTPRNAAEILDRVNEISFNSSLMREMRAIAFVTRLIDQLLVDDGCLKRVFIHSISADAVMKKLGASTKLNVDWGFLTHLHAAGRQYAGTWIEECFDRLGVESTVDIRSQYL